MMTSRILIVDDEAGILLSIDTTLQMAGMNNLITCQDSRLVMDLLAKVGVLCNNANL